MPRTHAELKRVYDALAANGKVNMFVFNSYRGNGELEAVVSSIDTDFPLLRICPWVACRNEAEPLSASIEGRIGSRRTNRLYAYNNDNWKGASQYVVTKVIELAQKAGRRKTERMNDTQRLFRFKRE